MPDFPLASEPIERAEEFRKHAREARLIALRTPRPKDRDSLLNLAEEYDRMARELDDEEATKELLRQTVKGLSSST